MKIFVFCLVLFLPQHLWAASLDKDLTLHCMQWTAEAVGETFLLMAIQQGYPYGNPIPTRPSAEQAYIEGVRKFRTSYVPRSRESARRCLVWVQNGWIPGH